MAETLISWSDDREFTGWYCKACGCKCPLPIFNDRVIELTVEGWNSFAAHNCNKQRDEATATRRAS